MVVVSSCTNYKVPEVVIKSDSDTVQYGSTYSAELYVPYNDSILPAFYIIRSTDTARLPIDTVKKCAVFKAFSSGNGLKEYKGFVEYVSKSGHEVRENFTIQFYVIK